MTKNDKANINKKLIDAKSSNIIVLEFKIVPVNDISAAIPMEHKVYDPFVNYGEAVN